MDDAGGHLDQGIFLQKPLVIQDGVLVDLADGGTDAAFAEDFLVGGCEEGTVDFGVGNVNAASYLPCRADGGCHD